MEDFIQISYLYDVFLRSTAKLPTTSRQPEVSYTSCAKLTLLRYSSGLEPGDSSPVYIRPCLDEWTLEPILHRMSYMFTVAI